jgi:acyl carrier protein
MSESSSTKNTKTSLEVERWLQQRIADELRLPVADIDPQARFVRFGLDSVRTVGIIAELSEWLGCDVDPAHIWDYPNLRSFSTFIAEEVANGSG